MKKIIFLISFFVGFIAFEGFAQFDSDGSYLWNSTSITYSVNGKTELVLANKDHYSNQINHLEYYHFDLIAYREISSGFSLGLGLRRTESYKISSWNPGLTYLFYGVWVFTPGGMKIRFANRIATRTYKGLETQYTLDNITNFDFFTHSTSKIPKPYFVDELFTNLNRGKIQTIRLYGGFHVLKLQHFALDLYYCHQKTRPSWVWKEYDIFGVSTKFRI